MDVVYGQPDMTGFVELDYNPQTGIRTYFRTNEDGTTTVCASQDIEPLLESNVQLYNESLHTGRMGDYQLIARVPDILNQKLGVSKAIEQRDRKGLAKILNDIDYRKFRTHKARV